MGAQAVQQAAKALAHQPSPSATVKPGSRPEKMPAVPTIAMPKSAVPHPTARTLAKKIVTKVDHAIDEHKAAAAAAAAASPDAVNRNSPAFKNAVSKLKKKVLRELKPASGVT